MSGPALSCIVGLSLHISYNLHETIENAMQASVTTKLAAGETLDHYRLDAEVARSGMATLFRATDLRTGRQVAVKVPHPEMEADPILLERFRREEEIGQEIDHPGIVKTYDGEERSRRYMVIEWVDGQLLRSILNAERKLPVDRAVALTLAICDALDTMHKHGVVHRDLKPENIMVDAQDRVKIIDFGIALKEDARRITHATLTPALGTPDYISPEQVKGQRGDQRSDVYALGAMLYEMLTGQPPFVGPNPLAVMNERLLHDPAPARELNPEIAPEVEEILFRALERDPHHRYSTAAEMAWELEHQELVGVDNTGRRPALRRRFLRGGRKMLLYAGLALVPVVLFVVMWLLAKR
ncbi:Non-specific serine/threonine protein kinase [Candidatus Sulfotelmatomonas gaucii]|uniref:non-specific serine/threonine protein kinase n=1 Tax=Candidatus Sulfuritelmatomonas gaucii TaxID=2043161 RepID=A0A2N9LCI2_9BACT|nr:Non-specific serine/threonine protein kinase [Candidatus Sulfotelmatomonas gaucii]